MKVTRAISSHTQYDISPYPFSLLEEKMEKKIRGLRLCTQRDCMLPLNRDKNGAINIGHKTFNV